MGLTDGTEWVRPHPLGPEISFSVAWNDDPANPTPTWHHHTERVLQLDTSSLRQTELDEFESGDLQVALDVRDRKLEPFYSSGPFFPNVIPRRRCRLRLRTDTGGIRFYFTGFLRGQALSWSDTAGKAAVLSMAANDIQLAFNGEDVTVSGYPSETCNLRIDRVADAIGINAADMSLDTSDHVCAAIAAAAEGEEPVKVNGLEHARIAAKSDGGYLFVSRAGILTFHNRRHRLDTFGTVAATLGDSGAPGEIPYSPGLVLTSDDSRLWNTASVVTQDGVRETHTDSTSRTKYWPATMEELASLLDRPGEAFALASLRVWANANPEWRMPALTIDLAERPNLSAAQINTLLSGDVGTRYRIRRRPPDTPDTPGANTLIETECHREGAALSIQPGRPIRLTIPLSPADPPIDEWVLGTSALGTDTYIGV